MLFGRPLISATNRLQSMEANLRFGLGRARENAELIALMHGEGIERHHADRLFADVGRGWNRQTLGFLGVVSFSSGYGTLLPVFPILVAAPQYIAGVMTLGVLMQAAQAFQKLTSALSWPVDNLGELARCRASVDRVVSLHKDMLLLEERAWRPVTHRIGRRPGSARELVLRDLSLANPDGRVLLEHLDLTIHRGERVLISGDPMVAASLFKAVAGLWPWGDGQILLPVDQSIVFLPQSPYLPDGSLRDALSYPRPAEDFSTAELRRALECAGVAWLTPRLEETDSWDRVLPLRARQRLGFARLLLHRPGWIFMQEPTDALDAEGEREMLMLLQEQLPRATLVTISQRLVLRRYHGRHLSLQRRDGSAIVEEAAPSES